MRTISILFFSLILGALGCSKEKLSGRAVLDCRVVAGAKILSEDDLPCNYNEVYLLDGQFYRICVCCLCNKEASMALDCEGQPLCNFTENCMDDFLVNATYLYSIELEE